VDVAVCGSFRRRRTRGVIDVGGSIVRCRLLRRPGPSPSIPLSVVDGAKDPADHKGNNARCVNLSICLARWLSIYCVVCLSCLSVCLACASTRTCAAVARLSILSICLARLSIYCVVCLSCLSVWRKGSYSEGRLPSVCLSSTHTHMRRRYAVVDILCSLSVVCLSVCLACASTRTCAAVARLSILSICLARLSIYCVVCLSCLSVWRKGSYSEGRLPSVCLSSTHTHMRRRYAVVDILCSLSVVCLSVCLACASTRTCAAVARLSILSICLARWLSIYCVVCLSCLSVWRKGSYSEVSLCRAVKENDGAGGR